MREVEIEIYRQSLLRYKDKEIHKHTDERKTPTKWDRNTHTWREVEIEIQRQRKIEILRQSLLRYKDIDTPTNWDRNTHT